MPRLLLLVPSTTYRATAFISAANKMMLDVTVASEEPSSLETLVPKDLLSLDFQDDDLVRRQVVSFAKKHPIDAVVAVDDQVTRAAAVIADALSISHNSVQAVENSLNKHLMRQRLSESGVPVPRFELYTTSHPKNEPGSVPYPCVIKPLSMAASRGVIRVNNSTEFSTAVDRLKQLSQPNGDQVMDLLVESYVPGWEVAVEGILKNSSLEVLALFDKPDPLVGPYFPETIYVTPSRLPRVVQDRIIQTTADAARAMGLENGPVHAELRGNNEELWLIELAARSIGGYCSRVLRFLGDRSLEEIILEHAMGRSSIDVKRESEAAGVLMLQAPVSGIFEAAEGVDDVRALPGIDEVIVSTRKGQTVTALPEGFLYVGFVFARASSPALVEQVLREAQARLRFIVAPSE